MGTSVSDVFVMADITDPVNIKLLIHLIITTLVAKKAVKSASEERSTLGVIGIFLF